MSRPPLPETRPRVEGDREEEILDAAVHLLHRVGYDRLTMDAVAKQAHASKATLYRRWESKQSLVVDALIRSKQAAVVADPDTGSLRGDLLGLFCHSHGLVAHSTLAAVMTAIQTDPVFAREFRARFLAPKLAVMRAIFDRASRRGELAPGVDPALVGPALAGILLHRRYVLGEDVTPSVVVRVVDQIILPAATGCRPSPSTQEPR